MDKKGKYVFFHLVLFYGLELCVIDSKTNKKRGKIK